jgi:hypothetical protein
VSDTPTTRLGLYKSASDGSENVDYTQDIGQNLDALDLAVGFQIVTSSTRPSSPYPGKPIAESNTSYRTYFSNGTSPASGSWVEIPNSSGTFGGNLTLASASSLSIGAATLTRASGGGLNANTNYLRTGSATTDVAYAAIISGDTSARARIYTDGQLELGPGNAARDTNLYRSAANTLKTDDSLIVATDLTVSGNINSATNLNMGAWSTWTPTWSTTTGVHSPSFGNATVDCRYVRIGRTILFYMNISFGSTTNFGTSATTTDNWQFSLPVTARATGVPIASGGYFVGSQTKATSALAQTNSTTTMSLYVAGGDTGNSASINGGLVDSLSPFTWAANDQLNLIGQYEAAS